MKYSKIPSAEYLLLLCVMLSILLSVYIYFIEGKQMLAIFVGLWAPTILGLINYINIKFK